VAISTPATLRHIAAVAVICTVAACSDVERCPSLEKLKSADPVADATAALARGDRNLLMLGGFVATVPGAEGATGPTKSIEGTSDTTTRPCNELRPVAESYARKYNATVGAAKQY
jgi:hypothetical protein